MRVQSAIVSVAVVLSIACHGDVKPATRTLDWSTIADDQMILVVTTDRDGNPQTTRLWIVVLDGFGYLRTSETPWSHDIERDPSFLLLANHLSYPVSATRVPYGSDEHARVMEAFGEKYGLLGRTVLAFYSLIGRYSGPADAKIFRLTASPPAADQRADAARHPGPLPVVCARAVSVVDRGPRLARPSIVRSHGHQTSTTLPSLTRPRHAGVIGDRKASWLLTAANARPRGYCRREDCLREARPRLWTWRPKSRSRYFWEIHRHVRSG